MNIKILLNSEIMLLRVVKNDKNLSNDRLPYDLIETNNGKYYEIRKTVTGKLVLLDVTDL